MKLCPKCKTQYARGQYCPKDGTSLDDVAPQLTPTGSVIEPVGSGVGEELVGQVIAERFRVMRSLGEGGMGHVYEARHLYIEKRVALKLLRAEITASPEAVERFQREAMAASTIGHENIVRIDDFGRLPDGRVYLTMEYLEGESLAALLGHGPLEFARVLDIMIQVCRGLAAAHAKGIIHRDMKADNVFITGPDDRVAILDFGIAKVSSHGSSNLTKTGAVFGTPNYMSPEQAMGQPVDHRCDIYSVGVMLYEMLTGAVPFEAESFMGVLTRHITEDPQPPSERAPGRAIPPELEAITLRAMAKKPEDRFADMEQLTGELVRVRAQSNGPGTIPLRNGRAPEPRSLLDTSIRPSGTVEPTAVPPGSVTATAGEMIGRGDAFEETIPRRRWGLAVFLLLAIGLGGWGVFAWRQTNESAPSAAQRAVQPAAASSLPEAEAKRVAGNPVDPGAESAAVNARARRVAKARARRAAARRSAARRRARKASAAPPPDSARPASPDAAVEPDTAPAQVKLILASVPSRAEIFRAGQRIGETPEVLLLTPGEQVELELKRRGFRPAKVELSLQSDTKRTVRLRRIRARRRDFRRRPFRQRDARIGRGGGNTTVGDHDTAHDHGESDHGSGLGGGSAEDDHGH